MVEEDLDDPVVQTVFKGLKNRWGRVLNLYRIFAWSPSLMRGWAAFAWTLRFELDASRRLRELLIVRIAGLLDARYEYDHHLRMANAEGIREEQIESLPIWRNSTLFSEDERAVLSLADDLALKRGAGADTMSALASRFPHRHVVEFLVTGSFYRGVAGIVNSLDLEPESGGELLPRND